MLERAPGAWRQLGPPLPSILQISLGNSSFITEAGTEAAAAIKPWSHTVHTHTHICIDSFYVVELLLTHMYKNIMVTMMACTAGMLYAHSLPKLVIWLKPPWGLADPLWLSSPSNEHSCWGPLAFAPLRWLAMCGGPNSWAMGSLLLYGYVSLHVATIVCGCVRPSVCICKKA